MTVNSEPVEVLYSKSTDVPTLYKAPQYNSGQTIKTTNIKKDGIYNNIEIDGDYWMDKVCVNALKSVKESGGPFAGIVVQIDTTTKKVIRYWENHNQVTIGSDPTAHAEVMAIRSACSSLGTFNLGLIKKNESKLPQPNEESYCVIYSSTEPCPMCYSAICWAKIKTLYFAATRFDAAVDGVNFSDEEIYIELGKPYSNRDMNVYQCAVEKSLDAFNLWKEIEKIEY